MALRENLRTERLLLRELSEEDAPFMVAMLNDADFLRYIGDRGVRNVDDAVPYLQNGPIKSYRDHGFGMYLVEQLSDGVPVGLCGLVRREGLDAPDLGFAFMPAYRSQGYAFEACQKTLKLAFDVLRIERLLAIATPDNLGSNRLLKKLGFVLRDRVRLQPDGDELQMYELLCNP